MCFCSAAGHRIDGQMGFTQHKSRRNDWWYSRGPHGFPIFDLLAKLQSAVKQNASATAEIFLANTGEGGAAVFLCKGRWATHPLTMGTMQLAISDVVFCGEQTGQTWARLNYTPLYATQSPEGTVYFPELNAYRSRIHETLTMKPKCPCTKGHTHTKRCAQAYIKDSSPPHDNSNAQIDQTW